MAELSRDVAGEVTEACKACAPEAAKALDRGPDAEVQRSGGEPGATSRRAVTVEDLPDYSRSLLRIRLPVVVTLARKREPVARIIQLGPGSIIQFEKSCEETLDMEIGGLPVATGEAVKVGDKFGLRISSMILPDERFTPVLSEADRGRPGRLG